jgi:hypothetical protein
VLNSEDDSSAVGGIHDSTLSDCMVEEKIRSVLWSVAKGNCNTVPGYNKHLHDLVAIASNLHLINLLSTRRALC